MDIVDYEQTARRGVADGTANNTNSRDRYLYRSRGVDRGSAPPPSPEKSQSYQVSIQCWAIIGRPPAGPMMARF